MKKLLTLLTALVLLLSIGTSTALAQDDVLPPNALATVEYRVNNGPWTAVPGFTANAAQNIYRVALPREEAMMEGTAEIRATPSNPTDWIYYYPESQTVSLHDGWPDSLFGLTVLKQGEKYEFGKGIFTQVVIEVPRISPTVEDLSVLLQTNKSGQVTLDEKPALHPGDYITFSISGTGMDNDKPLPGDIRLVVTGYTIDGATSPDFYWHEYYQKGDFSLKKLSAGEHELEIFFRAEQYAEVWSEESVPDTPPQYAWQEYGDMGEETSVKGVFTIQDISQYTLTVINGQGGGTGYPGDILYPSYDPAPEGKVFDKWVWSEGSVGDLAPAGDNAFVFKFGEGDATLTATYKDIPTAPQPSQPESTSPGNPESGDPISLGLPAMLAAVSLAGVLVLKKKNKTAQ